MCNHSYGNNGHYQACRGKHFTYQIASIRPHETILIDASRMDNLTDEDYPYGLEVDIYPTGEKQRYCYWMNDLGKSVCQSLESQGWTSVDGNE